ncbi:hypothetical protein Pmani_018888 [Petrolisthes manimaculis]|uniref:Uncharacterized protein n=1 Tax=Petrolisthes manimaculis TaxID=1843537 RepID=A0AAE1U689_9EUCA|nr:hypothetical protein Pmani_018888 [Petrolisthes manimaculis]
MRVRSGARSSSSLSLLTFSPCSSYSPSTSLTLDSTTEARKAGIGRLALFGHLIPLWKGNPQTWLQIRFSYEAISIRNQAVNAVIVWFAIR